MQAAGNHDETHRCEGVTKGRLLKDCAARAGFVGIKRPPEIDAAALGRGFEG